MKPIQFLDPPHNIIALCDGENKKDDYIGYFNPVLLRNWAQCIIDNFGESPVYLYSHNGEKDGKVVRALAAAVVHGDDMQIAVPGIISEVE